MNPEQEIGRQLGQDGVANVVAKAEQYCAHEEQRIALDNHAPIVQMKAELSLLVEEENRVREQLRQAPAPTDLRHHRRKKVMAWVVAAILTVTGFSLAVLTFAPFRLGWQGYLFCAGIAVVVPFLIERLLGDTRLEIAVKALTAIAAIAGIASLMLLADVRGHLLEQEIQTPSAVVMDDAQPSQPPPADDFYAKTLGTLRLATILLALAMELGAGIALRDAMAKAPHDPEEWKRLRAELALVRAKIVAAVGEITQLEDGPASFHARFWRDFYRSMLTQTVRSAMTKLLIVTVAVALLPMARAASPKHLDLVIALDLTKSTDIKGPDGKTEFQKNLDGVAGVLAQIPADSHVTVVGITDHSFAQPYILLSATIPSDPGYFGERLRVAQQQILAAWKARSTKLTPRFMQTDILGGLELAGQVFDQQPPDAERRTVVIFSDMRNHAPNLDLETHRRLADVQRLPVVSPQVHGLRGVQVDALGVEASTVQTSDWDLVERFWRKYLNSNGARLPIYSPLRTVPPVAFK